MESAPSSRKPPTLRAIAWLAAMLGAIAAVELILRAAVPTLHPLVDRAAGLDLTPLLHMPIPVLNKIDRGFVVLAAVWGLFAFLALGGLRFAQAVSQPPALRLLIAGQVILLVALMVFPVLLSMDVYAYVIYGRLYGLHGVNPYFLPLPLRPTLDPVIAECLAIYGNPPPGDDYGPLWTLWAGALARMTASTTLFVQVLCERAIAVAAAVVATWGLIRCVKERLAERMAAVARFAIHPLLLFESAVGAHNDLIMLAFAVWSFALVDSAPLVAGLLMGASIATKYVSALALPFLVIRARRSRGLKSALGLLLVSVIVVALTLKPFWLGRLTLIALTGQSAQVIMSPTWLVVRAASSVYALLHSGFAAMSGQVDETAFIRPTQVALIAAFAVVYGAALWRYAVRDRLDDLWIVAACLLWMAPALNPWYVLWLLPAVIVSRGAWAGYAYVFGLFALVRYAGEVPIYPPVPLLIALTLAIYLLPVFITRRSSGNRSRRA